MFLWVNQDGQADAAGNRNGSEWVKYCVTAEHNALWEGDASLKYGKPYHRMVHVYILSQRVALMDGACCRALLDLTVLQLVSATGKSLGGSVLHAGLEPPTSGELYDAYRLPPCRGGSACCKRASL